MTILMFDPNVPRGTFCTYDYMHTVPLYTCEFVRTTRESLYSEPPD